MTRAEVARAIGRSIATVRRMEGKELNPEVDWQGVHHFDAEEVEAVAEELRENGRRRPEHVSEMPDFLLVARLRNAEAERDELLGEVRLLRDEHESLRKADTIGAHLLELANDALLVLEGSGNRRARSLRYQYDRITRMIPG